MGGAIAVGEYLRTSFSFPPVCEPPGGGGTRRRGADGGGGAEQTYPNEDEYNGPLVRGRRHGLVHLLYGCRCCIYISVSNRKIFNIPFLVGVFRFQYPLSRWQGPRARWKWTASRAAPRGASQRPAPAPHSLPRNRSSPHARSPPFAPAHPTTPPFCSTDFSLFVFDSSISGTASITPTPTNAHTHTHHAA